MWTFTAVIIQTMITVASGVISGVEFNYRELRHTQTHTLFYSIFLTHEIRAVWLLFQTSYTNTDTQVNCFMALKKINCKGKVVITCNACLIKGTIQHLSENWVAHQYSKILVGCFFFYFYPKVTKSSILILFTCYILCSGSISQ